MSEQEKKKYNDMAEKDKERYQAEKEKHEKVRPPFLSPALTDDYTGFINLRPYDV
jgi:hypothetical protein